MANIEIVLGSRSVLSYAAAYNHSDLIQSLNIRTTDGSNYPDVVVSVSLTADGMPEPLLNWERQLQSLGPMAVQWDASDFKSARLDSNRIADVTDHRRGQITVSITQGADTLSTTASPCTLLPNNFWVAVSPFQESALELAALAQPNHPALVPVLQRAREILGRTDSDSGFSGYQALENGGGVAHIDAMVRAIYEAVREINIGYINPLPSWASEGTDHRGQPVRTAGQVLVDRFGTCLDTAVLCASILENAGLHPVIVLVPGHAFAGYWRVDQLGRRESVAPPLELMNSIQSGELVLFETTTLCGGAESEPFDVAARLGPRHLDSKGALDTSDPWKVAQSWVVDVVHARYREQILPLPARVVATDGTVEIVEYRPQDFTVNMLDKAVSETASTAAGLVSSSAPPRVRKWMDSLLDLTLRNPLLNYRYPKATSTSLYVPSEVLGSVEDMLQSGVRLRLTPGPMSPQSGLVGMSPRNTAMAELVPELLRLLSVDKAMPIKETSESFAPKLRRIAAQARSLIAENGTNSLHLALGMVVWTPEGKQEVNSPLILLPVNLVPSNRSRTFHLEIDPTSAVTPNFSLAEKLKRDVGIDLPKLVEPDLDDAGIDIPGLIAYVRQEFTKANLHDFRIDESCTLGFFDFSTYRMWRDLQDNWPTLTEKPLVKHLVHTPFDAFSDPSIGEVADEVADHLDDFAAALPVASDGSQALAVKRALAGQTFVLQGPPGTGKSQTITNLLAQALQSGLRVLFIAEKSTALGVVRDRLAGVGLEAFSLNLHSRGMSPAEVRQQLARSLDASAFADAEGHATAQTDIDRTIPPLQKYPERLHQVGAFDESAYSARNRLLALGDGTELPINLSQLGGLTLEKVGELRRTLRELADAGPSAGTALTNAWSLSSLDADAITSDFRAGLLQLAKGISAMLSDAASREPARVYLQGVTAFEDLARSTQIDAADLLDLATVDASALPAARERREHITAMLTSWASRAQLGGVTPQALAAPVDELRTALATARASFFIGRKKRVEAIRTRLMPFAAPVPGPEVGALEATLDAIGSAQTDARVAAKYIALTPGLTTGPGWNPLVDEDRAQVSAAVERLERSVALLADDGTDAKRQARTLVGTGTASDRALVAELARTTQRFFDDVGANSATINLWLAGRPPIATLADAVGPWVADLEQRGGLSLSRWSAARVLLGRFSANGLGEQALALATGRVAYVDAEVAFERGFLRAVLEQQIELESLHAFDGRQHDSQIRVYSRAAGELRRLSPGILGDSMLKARSFDSSTTMGAVGELRRELERKRGTKPIRQLIQSHWHVITGLTPCVLAVPDAVVRYLDASTAEFDLVVFDEASQVKVAHAVGALGKAKAAVVVGDSKQMPPTSIAEASDDDADADEADTVIDEESILTECVQARVPAMMLNWHYRSADESLIAFSNAKYYDGHLNSLPSPSGELATKGVTFRRIDGQFMHRGSGAASTVLGTNRAEAEAIVGEVRRRANDPASADQSIGVVTFNKPQQQLIRSLLDEIDDEATQRLVNPGEEGATDERVEVWNLESVQGQERDVILFSVAFSKNATGRVPLNFGPLNKSGGERRLNVAVTRARRQVIVFCSFEPEELDVKGSSSVGLNHLAEYLRAAKYGAQASGALASSIVKPPDRHRDAIADAFRSRGVDVGVDVGLSEFKVDIALRAPGAATWAVGVLLDGAGWHARPTVGDRDALPKDLLTSRMGWPEVARIWAPDWLRDPDGEITRITELLAEASARPERPVPVLAPPVSAPGTTAGGQTDPQSSAPRALASASGPTAPVRRVEPFADVPLWGAWKVSRVGAPGDLDALHSSQVRDAIKRVATSVVDHEGPMDPTRLARIIGQSFGLQRVVGKRVDDITAIVRPQFSRGSDGFFFPVGRDPQTYSEWRRSRSGDGRVIEEISLVEAGNAMVAITNVSRGASAEDLIRESATVFGVSRVTVGIRERLEAALKLAVKRGVLEEQNGYYVAKAAQ